MYTRNLFFGCLAAGSLLGGMALAGTVSVTENTVVTADNAATYTAADVIDISEGAVLRFNQPAAITLKARFTGKGVVAAVKEAAAVGLITLTGDSSSFQGFFAITNVGVTAANVNAFGRCPVYYCNSANNSATLLKYTAAGDYNHPLTWYGGANYGVSMSACATNSGEIVACCNKDNARLSGGGAITGNITEQGKILYCSGGIHLLGESVSGTGTLYADGSGFWLKAKVSGLSIQCANNNTSPIYCLAEDRFDHEKPFTMGCGYSNTTAFDLYGYNQTVGRLVFSNPSGKVTDPATVITSSRGPATLTLLNQTSDQTNRAQFNGELSLDYSSSSDKTMTFTGSATRNSTGAITVRSGKVVFDADTTWTALSRVEAVGGGRIHFKTTGVNPNGLDVKFTEGGRIEIDEGLTITVCHAIDGDTYLTSGRHDATTDPQLIEGLGAMIVVKGEPVEDVRTFVWTGAQDADPAAAANWVDGEAPTLSAGNEILQFSVGANSVAFRSDANLYGLSFVTNVHFHVNAQDVAQRPTLTIGEGGVFARHSPYVASSQPAIHVNVPLCLSTVQTWDVGDRETITVRFHEPVSSPETGVAPINFKGEGWIWFDGDNSELKAPIKVLKEPVNGPVVVVANNHGLGATNRPVYFTYRPPRFIGTITNDVPIVSTTGTGDNWNYDSSSRLVQRAPVRTTNWTHIKVSHCSFEGGLFFTGGGWFQTDTANGVWIRNAPLDASGTLVFDNVGHVHLATPDNLSCDFALNKSWVVCETNNAIKPVSCNFSWGGQTHVGDATLGKSYGCVDLNGFDLTLSMLVCRWDADKDVADAFGYVRSEQKPAVLTLTGAASGKKRIRFVGEAGLDFAGSGTFAFTNALSTTTGPLKVSSGTVRFEAGAGWTATTNVVLGAEGMIEVAAGAGATAFGEEQGKSKAWLSLYEGGRLSVAADEQPTVEAVAQLSSQGRAYYLNGGVYGGRDAPATVGGVAVRKVDWMIGTGTLKVRRHGGAALTIVIR